MNEREELETLLSAAGVDPALGTRLAAYGARVLEANRRFNLTGARSAEELVSHLLDSLTVAPYVSAPYVDVGSGGGMPAIPAALATGVPVTFVEATAKKAAFLQGLSVDLGIEARAIAERAERAGHDPALREYFASATARAVSAVTTVAEYLAPFLRIGGLAVLQRGGFDQMESAALADAALMLGCRVEDVAALSEGRHIVTLRKVAPTPARFPRRTGVPEKRPLCR